MIAHNPDDNISLLLVDNDADDLAAIEAELKSAELRLVHAASAEEALQRVQAQDFAAILLGAVMPGMDGVETARLLRSNERSAETPVLFVASLAEEMHPAEIGYATGIVGYPARPEERVSLKAKVALLVDLFRIRQTLRSEIDAVRLGPTLVTRRIYGAAGIGEGPRKTVRLLMVEDSDTDALLAREALKQASMTDFVLTRTITLREALHRLAVESFDLVLLDLSLPDSAGTETVKKFRELAAEIPVLVATSVWDESTYKAALQFGLQGYLLKALLTPTHLEYSIRAAIESKDYLRRVQEQELRAELQGYEDFPNEYPDTRPGRAVPAGRLDDDMLADLTAKYRTLIAEYVRSVRQRTERPKTEVHALAARLAGLGARASDLVKLHLRALQDLTNRSPSHDRQIIANDARLLLVDLLGTLLDRYETWSGRDSPEEHPS